MDNRYKSYTLLEGIFFKTNPVLAGKYNFK
jgi:hypothetical protein